MNIIIKPTESQVKAKQYLAKCEAKRNHEACLRIDRRERAFRIACIILGTVPLAVALTGLIVTLVSGF